MSLLDRPSPTASCGGRCGDCAAGGAADEDGRIRGAPLALWSALVFLLPLAGLAGGAALAGGTGARAVAGALAGGAAGVALARLAVWWRSPATVPNSRPRNPVP